MNTLEHFPKSVNDTELMRALRTSLEAANLTWALIQSAYALSDRAMPDKITDVNAHERRQFEDRALACLLACNRDAEIFATRQASYSAWDLFEQFVQDYNLDWLDSSHPVNVSDALDSLMDRMAEATIKRYHDILNGIFPSLSQHLARVERMRAFDAKEPA